MRTITQWLTSVGNARGAAASAGAVRTLSESELGQVAAGGGSSAGGFGSGGGGSGGGSGRGTLCIVDWPPPPRM